LRSTAPWKPPTSMSRAGSTETIPAQQFDGRRPNEAIASPPMTDDSPNLVARDDLLALGLDPETYRMTRSYKHCVWLGYALDRKRDAAIIERLQSMQEAHKTTQ